jgi:hypothetical protein
MLHTCTFETALLSNYYKSTLAHKNTRPQANHHSPLQVRPHNVFDNPGRYAKEFSVIGPKHIVPPERITHNSIIRELNDLNYCSHATYKAMTLNRYFHFLKL